MRRPFDGGPLSGESASRPARADSRESVQSVRGLFGEDLAALYLAGIGLRILGRNRRVGRLEVDLVAESAASGELVVIEVRLRTREDHGRPEETVDRRKRARLRSAGRKVWEEQANPDLTLRFDLVAILLERRGLRLRHHPRFLDPDGPGAESLPSRF